MADIVVEKWVDEDSPRLFIECAKGASFAQIWIRVNIGEGELVPMVMEIRLHDVWITSYMVRGERGTEFPRESFIIGYGKMYYYYYYPDQVFRIWRLGSS